MKLFPEHHSGNLRIASANRRPLAFISFIPFLFAAGTASAQPPKIALVNIQQAVVDTTDGHEAEKRLDAQFRPRKEKLDAEQHEIAALANQLKQEGLSEEDRARINQQMEDKAAAVDQETEKADADLKEAQNQVLKELGPKMVATIAQYARDHGYSVVFDISSSEVPRLYAPNATDITREVTAAYEKQRGRK